MTPALARDCLTIFVDGDEVPGVIVYGLFTLGSDHPVPFPAYAWFSAPVPREFRLHGDGWEVMTWEVPIDVWPTADGWQAAVHVTLRAMIERGSRIAWVGSEGGPFCDPPDLFNPDWMSGGVLAWMTDVKEFACPLDPDLPLQPVGDDILRKLRDHARGLADAT